MKFRLLREPPEDPTRPTMAELNNSVSLDDYIAVAGISTKQLAAIVEDTGVAAEDVRRSFEAFGWAVARQAVALIRYRRPWQDHVPTHSKHLLKETR
ncbi:hypothetical protein [Brevibacterium sediminis]